MNFKNDLAKIAKKELADMGIDIPSDWDDYHICLNYMEIKQRWFNTGVPYKILYSKELLEKFPKLTKEEQSAIKDIEKCLSLGETIAPYMSKLIRKTDIDKSDFLLKNWGIYHLHLEKLSLLKVNFKMPNLLFFQPKGNIIHFIDVKPHPKGSTWFDRDLLEIIYSNWPWLLRFLNGVKPTYNIPDNEIHRLTKRMVTILDFHGGALIPTNFGVATSGNSSMAVREADRLLNSLKKSELYLQENDAEIKKQIFNETGTEITDVLDYELIIESDYFVAYEKNLQIKIKLFEIG